MSTTRHSGLIFGLAEAHPAESTARRSHGRSHGRSRSRSRSRGRH